MYVKIEIAGLVRNSGERPHRSTYKYKENSRWVTAISFQDQILLGDKTQKVYFSKEIILTRDHPLATTSDFNVGVSAVNSPLNEPVEVGDYLIATIYTKEEQDDEYRVYRQQRKDRKKDQYSRLEVTATAFMGNYH